MYYVEVKHNGEVIATTYQDLLSDSVQQADQLSFRDCNVTIYECIKSLIDYDIIATVLSWNDNGDRN